MRKMPKENKVNSMFTHAHTKEITNMFKQIFLLEASDVTPNKHCAQFQTKKSQAKQKPHTNEKVLELEIGATLETGCIRQ